MNLETRLVDLVVRLAPWLAPLPTAYLVGRSTVLHLAWPLPVGWAAALALESLGLASIHTALTFWEYNLKKLKSDPPAPTHWAAGAAVVYFLSAIGLTVLVDTVPTLVTFAPIIFPVLSMVAMAIIGMRTGHAQRIVDAEAAALKRKRERVVKKKEKTTTAPAVQRDRRNNLERARGLYEPGMTGKELGALLNVSPSYARKLRAKIERNGHKELEHARASE